MLYGSCILLYCEGGEGLSLACGFLLPSKLVLSDYARAGLWGAESMS